MAIKVVKFGGSSLASAEQFRKVADIIHADTDRRYVVPSAPGKRFGGDTKVTDMLYACYDAVSSGSAQFAEAFAPIAERYQQIIDELGLKMDLSDRFEVIRGNFEQKNGRDYAASRGEFLNGILLAKYLGIPFVDAADVVFFDRRGMLDGERTYAAMREMARRFPRAVIPGFYGRAADGSVKTFSRGGSDITGSIVARGVGASLYENWTDVSGFYAADPRLISNPSVIKVISFRELRELSYMGATVLHEDAVFPVRAAGIPINIRNTNSPEDPGTMILPLTDAPVEAGRVTGIAGKKGFSVITMEKDMMNQEVGFVRKVLNIFEKHGISIEHIPSGIDTMGVLVQSRLMEGCREEIIEEIRESVHPDTLDIVDNIALLAVVGRGMVKSKGIAARLLSAVACADVNIRMIDQGSSEMNIILGVDESDFDRAVRAVYVEFFVR